MFDSMMTSVPQILGFGFLGLSVLMVALGYLALLKVTSHPEPSDSSIALCRFFLILCVGCLILAGPLQIGLMAANRLIQPPPNPVEQVNVSFDMPTRIWKDYHGSVHLRHDGQPYELQGGRKVPGIVRADGSVEVDVDDLITGFEKQSANLLDATQEATTIQGDLNVCRADLSAALVTLSSTGTSPIRAQALPAKEIVEDAG